MAHTDALYEKHPPTAVSHFWDGVNWDEPETLAWQEMVNSTSMTADVGKENVKVRNRDGELQVFYRRYCPDDCPGPDVLLLHGMSFTSDNWAQLGTMQFLASMGYHVTAIDLPGFGKTEGEQFTEEQSPADFIKSFCDCRGIKRPIIVAPSMAGSFALPFVMAYPNDVSALIAVAPVATSGNYSNLQIPILHVRGSRDTTMGESAAQRFSVCPNAATRIIANAGHAAYMNQPDEWHKILYIFLNRLKKLPKK